MFRRTSFGIKRTVPVPWRGELQRNHGTHLRANFRSFPPMAPRRFHAHLPGNEVAPWRAPCRSAPSRTAPLSRRNAHRPVQAALSHRPERPPTKIPPQTLAIATTTNWPQSRNYLTRFIVVITAEIFREHTETEGEGRQSVSSRSGKKTPSKGEKDSAERF